MPHHVYLVVAGDHDSDYAGRAAQSFGLVAALREHLRTGRTQFRVDGDDDGGNGFAIRVTRYAFADAASARAAVDLLHATAAYETDADRDSVYVEAIDETDLAADVVT
jgi:hypothetical protein